MPSIPPHGPGSPRAVRILFVCSRNQWRSPTAERLFRRWPGVEVRSAGTASSARRRVREDDLRWADLVLAMEPRHVRQILRRFPDASRDTVLEVLDIPDTYRAMAPELVAWLEEVVPPRIEAARRTG